MDEGVSPLLQTWYIIESRGIGKGKRHEITPDGLQIGRSAAADIIVLVRFVNITAIGLDDNHHVKSCNSARTLKLNGSRHFDSQDLDFLWSPYDSTGGSFPPYSIVSMS